MGVTFKYNGVDLHALGKLRIIGESERHAPEELPQRTVKTLRVRLDAFNDSYAATRSQLAAAVQAFKASSARLEWSDGETADVYAAQEAVLLETTFPEDPNSWGTRHMRAEFTFVYHALDLVADALGLSYTASGGAMVVFGPRGIVEGFKFGQNTERFHSLRSHRRGVSGSVSASGVILGDPLATLDERRVELLAKAAELGAVVKEKSDGTLAYKTATRTAFERTVRIDRFEAELNQACTGINWSLSGVYTDFPNEAGYAIGEVKVRAREDKEAGQWALSLSGRVWAETEAAARAQLALVRAAYVPAAEGGVSYVRVKEESVADHARADTDGAAFIELVFDEEWRKSISSVVSWDRKISDTEDNRAGLIRRTYSGTVLAVSQTSWSDAYRTAVAHALTICAGGAAQMRLSAAITADDPQLSRSGEAHVTGVSRFCRVAFTFEYQLKGAAIWMEVNSETQTQAFGVDAENVSGFVVAPTLEAANREYEILKSAYHNRIFRDDKRAVEKVVVSRTEGVAVGASLSPAESSAAWGTSVNAGETQTVRDTKPTPEYRVEQALRLTFSWSLHMEKPTQGSIGVRWSIETSTDYVARTVSKNIQGSVFCSGELDGSNAVTLLFDQLGVSGEVELRRRESVSRDSFVGSLVSLTANSGFIHGFSQFDFGREYVSEMSGNTGQLIACRVEETVRHSGPRWVARPTAFGRDVMQQCGYESGQRMVRAEVIASDEATGLAWLRRQYWAPFNDEVAGEPATRRRTPPTISGGAEALPLTDLVFRSGAFDGAGPESGSYAENVLVWRGTIEHAEFLTDSDFLD